MIMDNQLETNLGTVPVLRLNRLGKEILIERQPMNIMEFDLRLLNMVQIQNLDTYNQLIIYSFFLESTNNNIIFIKSNFK